MDPVDYEYLDKKFKDLKSDFSGKLNDKLAPVIELQKRHQVSLHGTSGNNGLSGTVKVLLWGYGLLSLAVAKLLWN